jgi:hypothetical protein
MVVEDWETADAEASTGAVEVHIHRFIVHADYPEQAVRVNVHVEVVNLFGNVGRSSRTSVEVKSNKSESAFNTSAIRIDKPTLAKAHVRPEGEGRCDSGLGVRPSATPVNVRQTHEPIEVCNFRRIADFSERS